MIQDDPVTVLIAEDEVLVSMFLADLVEDAGMTVCGVARSIDEAMRLARECRPDLALLDLNLRGGASGIALARDLIADYGTTVLFVSGETGVADRPDVAALRPAAVLEKPFLPDQLTAALEQAARQRSARAL